MKKHPVDGAHARARTLRQNMTEAERRVWQILRSHRMTGYQFRRQVPIGRYIADFVCHEARLIVEIDARRLFESLDTELERRPRDGEPAWLEKKLGHKSWSPMGQAA